MNYHQGLAKGRWQKLSFVEQMANIGSEVERTIGWKNKGNSAFSNRAFERALELLDLTMSDPKNISRLKELARLREVLVDYFWDKNIYKTSSKLWQKYFYPFHFATRANY